MPGALYNLPDEELACRACAGSTASFEEIVRRFQVPLARFLARKFPSRRDVEDILQDTFIKTWQSLHRYEKQYAFRTWIYTIAYRLAVSRGRRETIPGQSLPDHAAGDDPPPGAAVEREDQRASLWRTAREVLSEEQYTALWLHYVDDIPAGDVAKILNRSWVSVKTLMHRARRKLMPHLAEHAPARPALRRAEGVPLAIPQPLAVKAGEP